MSAGHRASRTRPRPGRTRRTGGVTAAVRRRGLGVEVGESVAVLVAPATAAPAVVVLGRQQLRSYGHRIPFSLVPCGAAPEGEPGRHRTADSPRNRGRRHTHSQRLAPAAVVPYLPAVLLGHPAQLRVRVDRDGGPDQGQHRDVVGRVTVGSASAQVEPFPLGKRADGRRLGRPVQQLADQLAGVDAVPAARRPCRVLRSARAGGR